MVINGEWVTDVKKMTCRNKNNNIVILFKKINGNLVGEIKTLPMKIVNKWATEGQGGDKDLKNTVTEAELMFYKAYFENEGIKIN
jgi:hypothetical protein